MERIKLFDNASKVKIISYQLFPVFQVSSLLESGIETHCMILINLNNKLEESNIRISEFIRYRKTESGEIRYSFDSIVKRDNNYNIDNEDYYNLLRLIIDNREDSLDTKDNIKDKYLSELI